MTDEFRIEMLPAREGDCFVLVYGPSERPRRVLIDGGRAATYRTLKSRFAELPEDQRTFELLIVTHVDRDHIEGVLKLLTDPALPFRFRDVWFNGYDHLRDPKLETFGAVQGECLTTTLLERTMPWNEAFGRKSVELRDGSDALELDGGLVLTLLSPDRPKLVALLPRWEEECREQGLMPGRAPERAPPPPGLEAMGGLNIEALAVEPFQPDRTAPNGTSIAVLAEYGGRRVLLAADAHPDRLIHSLKALSARSGSPLDIDAFKLPHHGSRYNVSRELIEAVSCRRYLISTNGSYFKHPDPVAVARVIKYGGEGLQLIFNYASAQTTLWDNTRWKRDYGYVTTYPAAPDEGLLTIGL